MLLKVREKHDHERCTTIPVTTVQDLRKSGVIAEESGNFGPSHRLALTAPSEDAAMTDVREKVQLLLLTQRSRREDHTLFWCQKVRFKSRAMS